MEKGDWGAINHYLPILHVEDTCGIVATDGRNLLGACVYDNWTRGSVQCHLLIRYPLIIRRGWLELIYGHAFNHPDRKFIIALVPGDNELALKLNKHMGFTEKCRFPEAFSEGVDYVVMQMKREDCRWLEDG